MLKNYSKNKQHFQDWTGNTQIRYCRTDKMAPNQNHSHLKHLYLISKSVNTLKWQQITPYSSCLFTFYVMCTFIFVDSCQKTHAKPSFYELIHSLISKTGEKALCFCDYYYDRFKYSSTNTKKCTSTFHNDISCDKLLLNKAFRLK